MSSLDATLKAKIHERSAALGTAAAANVAVAALLIVATMPDRTQGLGMVSARLFPFSETVVASINLQATLIGALFCLPIGMLVDRYGVRPVAVLVTMALGISVALMSRADSYLPLLFYTTLTRGFGQSALSVVSITLVGKAFRRRVGPAMGVYAVLVGLGFIAYGVYCFVRARLARL